MSDSQSISKPISVRFWIKWLIPVAIMGLAWFASIQTSESDHSVGNANFALGLIVSGLTLILIFLFEGRLARSLRGTVFAAIVLAFVGFLSFFRFTGFSGEMVPKFSPRFVRTVSPRAFPNQQTANIASKETSAADNSNSERQLRELSFPQFLGQNRDGIIPDIKLAGDWKTNPPEVVWRIPIGAGWSGFAIADGLAITLEEQTDGEALVAFNLTDGSRVWEAPLPRKHFSPLGGAGPTSTPTVNHGSVLAQGSSGVVVCTDLQTGKPLWSVDLLQMAGVDQQQSELEVSWGRSASLLVHNDLVIVPLGGKPAGANETLVALDRESGEVKWKAGTSQISYASPVIFQIAGLATLVSVNSSDVTGHDLATGKILWSEPWPGNSNGDANVSQPIFVSGENKSAKILLTKGYGAGSKLICVTQSDDDTWTTEKIWSDSSVMKTKFTSGILVDGFVYGLSDGIFECIDVATGKRKWKDSRNGRFGHGQLLVVGNDFLITSEQGEIVLTPISQSTPKSYQTFPVLSDITWNPPAIAGDRLLIRNGVEAACVKLKRFGQ